MGAIDSCDGRCEEFGAILHVEPDPEQFARMTRRKLLDREVGLWRAIVIRDLGEPGDWKISWDPEVGMIASLGVRVVRRLKESPEFLSCATFVNYIELADVELAKWREWIRQNSDWRALKLADDTLHAGLEG